MRHASALDHDRDRRSTSVDLITVYVERCMGFVVVCVLFVCCFCCGEFAIHVYTLDIVKT
jgi:hypothetical protein